MNRWTCLEVKNGKKIRYGKKSGKERAVSESPAIAKKFTMGISTKDHRAMVLAHECYTNARFYQELGVNADEAIAEGEAVVKRLYG